MRDFIRDAMSIVQPHTDAKIRAYVIMSNHLHVLLQQGHAPLWKFMQPLLRRIALAVQRKYRIEGHVFGQTYWDSPCVDPRYLRATVDYIHANPVRAELCASPADWPWSSYSAYLHPERKHTPRIEPIGDVASLPPHISLATLYRDEPFSNRPDLRDTLAWHLRELTNDELSLFDLRVSRTRAASRLRRTLITRAAEFGYRGSLIAEALGVSDATVSKAIRAARAARPRLIGI